MKLVTKNSLITSKEINVVTKKVALYLRDLKKHPAAFMEILNDHDLLAEVKKIARIHGNVKYIFVIGIGGSNLGAKAIYDALLGYHDPYEPTRAPKMLFADTTDPKIIDTQITFLKKQKLEDVLFVVISKSGGTTETVVNAEILLRVHHPKNRVVVITDQDSPLWQEAQKNKFTLLAIPPSLGGRFSVLSAVGLLPLAVAGIDITELQRGALEMNKLCTLTDPAKNPALTFASILYAHYKAGKPTNVLFLFHSELASLGAWYRQLVAESLGKNSQGFMPDVAIGSTDLHSLGQLYFDGPRDKVTTFIYSGEILGAPRVPNKTIFGALSRSLTGKSVAEIMDAILTGTKIAYTKQGLPFMEIELPHLDAKNLGSFMQFKMMETIFLAKLMNVNAFDQPAVELYKEETRRILQGHL